MMDDQQPIDNLIVDRYRTIVGSVFPGVAPWPVVSGWNVVNARYGSALILLLKHTGFAGLKQTSQLTVLHRAQVGVDAITRGNRHLVKEQLEPLLRPGPYDLLLVLEDAIVSQEGDRVEYRIPGDVIDEQLVEAAVKHAFAQGLLPMRVFLSHKNADKPKVREYYETLKLLGFDPWLDEHAMAAGANLERALLEGMNQSCAAIFFVTPNYQDERFLATEVDYAIQQKRKKGDLFSIVTLVFDQGDKKGVVPDLLRTFVWKEPTSDLEALREILKALPLKVGPVRPGR
ncbi:toll/interleukin-1 receptor domain-containing protein [Polyangium sp. y55x31]|uniref:toll/interleukin-1 receptor domain-containing protein n=1 Tax=Polyangium sp. y55x31 TaxID=3042688 RepID=UPI00248306AE|nr:toll/interleukin-1 receptor domain-containing protein [Polyangium sp. y55x31]MDI1480371.1 toll/interleukin-1 receptor domain-containing protein [Polyangium sp. y55x31]